MNTTETTALWIYIACMALGILIFAAWSRDPKSVPRYEYAVAMAIPLWSGLAYLSMIIGPGVVEVGDKTVYAARYVDWVVTTPLLVLALCWTAMHRSEHKDKALIFGLMFVQVVMIVAGLSADFATDRAVAWTWYLVGCAALAVMLWGFWGPLRAIADAHGPDLGRVYRAAAAYLTIQWLAYPTVFLLGPSLEGVISGTSELVLFVVLPVISKVGFSLFDLSMLRRLPRYGAHGPAVAAA